jgi:hypothetical protein
VHIDLCVGAAITAAEAGADVEVLASGAIDAAGLSLSPGLV